MKYTLYFDGACRGNPGKASYGVVIFDENEKEIHTDNGFLGITTNNVAEYCGLLRGLIICQNMNIKNLLVKGDSNLAIQQVTGKWKVKNENLKKIVSKIKEIIPSFHTIEFKHVYRKFNKRADALANQALDSLI